MLIFHWQKRSKDAVEDWPESDWHGVGSGVSLSRIAVVDPSGWIVLCFIFLFFRKTLLKYSWCTILYSLELYTVVIRSFERFYSICGPYETLAMFSMLYSICLTARWSSAEVYDSWEVVS